MHTATARRVMRAVGFLITMGADTYAKNGEGRNDTESIKDGYSAGSDLLHNRDVRVKDLADFRD